MNLHSSFEPFVELERLGLAEPPDLGLSRGLLIRSADELQQRRFEPIRYIVPGYVAEGCTLLAGRPKLGKSWLVLEMGLAIAGGASCLGGI
jgi:hypothetical protein